MPWTIANPPPPAKYWSQSRKRRCVEAANAALDRTGDEGQAVLACIHAAQEGKHSLAEPQSRIKSRIKRASAQARREAGRIDENARRELTRIYRRARAEIEEVILGYASEDENLRLEVLGRLRSHLNTRIDQLTLEIEGILDDSLRAAADAGVGAMTGSVDADLIRLAEEAMVFVRNFMAADGLQLSDRLWRIDRHARELVGNAVEQAVIQGHSASRAAQDLLGRGEPVPAELERKMRQSNAGRVARVAGEQLMTGEGAPYDNALRVMRTEINRAHGEAYQSAALEHPDAIGTRFLLSPRHPKRDICDLHASVNRHGLGPGVYPPGKNPWPAHPNTLSYVEVVFGDEVSDADREGKEDRVGWLKRQPTQVQIDVLGSRKKADALREGILKENQIATPWWVLKERYRKQGIDVEALG